MSSNLLEGKNRKLALDTANTRTTLVLSYSCFDTGFDMTDDDKKVSFKNHFCYL